MARCEKTRSLGVATCTTALAVGSVVPHVEDDVGAIATQSNTNVFHGTNGLNLLKRGFEPRKVMDSTLALDSHSEHRQLLIIDSQGRTAAHTGNKNADWREHIEGENFVIGGNNVSRKEVTKAMVEVFTKSRGYPLHERLLRTIEAGEKAGGCNKPDRSAALLVVGIEDELRLFSRPRLDLRIDSSDDPTGDLRKLYESYKEFVKERHRDEASIRGF